MRFFLLALTLAAGAAVVGCGSSEESENAARMEKALNQQRPDLSKAPGTGPVQGR